MATSPIVIFTEFQSRNDPILHGWSTFREHVRAGAVTAAAESSRLLTPSGEPRLRAVETAPQSAVRGAYARSGIWRLLATNHREFARSLFLYESLRSAREHVLELQQLTEEMTITLIRGPIAGQHGWYGMAKNVSVLSCSRWYGAAGLSRESAALCLDALRTAVVSEVARDSKEVMRRSGRSALRERERQTSW